MRSTLPALLLAGAACAAPAPDTYTTVNLAADTLEITGGAVRVGAIPGFRGPESAQYDSAQDVFFVSNMAGAGSTKDGIGYIVRVNAADLSRMDVFVEGGRGDVVLNAPKGMVVSGGVLWVADIDVVRGFDARTGEPVGDYDLRPHGAVQLNGITVGPDSALYVTDTGILMTEQGVLYPRGDRVFVLERDGSVRVFAEGEDLALPNGIAWDAANQRFVVASFHPFRSEVYALGTSAEKTLIGTGPGRFDGLVILADGRIVTTSWVDHSVHVFDGDRHYRIATNLPQAADIGFDTRRNRLLIPLALPGRVEIWRL